MKERPILFKGEEEEWRDQLTEHDIDSVKPFETLCVGILERAIFDIQELTVYGFIKDGKCVYTNLTWPIACGGFPKRLLGYFCKPIHVEELLHFFRSKQFMPLINILGLDIAEDVILDQVFNEDKVSVIVLDRKERYAKAAKLKRKMEDYYASDPDEYCALQAS